MILHVWLVVVQSKYFAWLLKSRNVDKLWRRIFYYYLWERKKLFPNPCRINFFLKFKPCLNDFKLFSKLNVYSVRIIPHNLNFCKWFCFGSIQCLCCWFPYVFRACKTVRSTLRRSHHFLKFFCWAKVLLAFDSLCKHKNNQFYTLLLIFFVIDMIGGKKHLSINFD